HLQYPVAYLSRLQRILFTARWKSQFKAARQTLPHAGLGQRHATLPLTIPRRVFKSSAKDSIHCSVEITIQGGPTNSSACRAWPKTRAFGGRNGPYCWSAIGQRTQASVPARILT
ncbi:hypothetical protein LINPERHAP2_LOCUS44503, partial [Linum perenne]